ncbi:hypothetical protein [Paraburkholderia sp. BCC1876]|uniref:hypothetical protein n=1 Tax=Paraburkholderia sp. BCC1876 TaxID=2676303 RepID=UPI001591AAED|nr:hypothetical protein [Paraburkholderia sp. BCC1876]
MLKISELQYLATRLRRVDSEECGHAARLVEAAIQEFDRVSRSLQVEHDMFHQAWDHVSRALDDATFSPEHHDELDAIEAEIAGRVLTARMALGQLVAGVQSDSAPRRSRVRAFLDRFA